MTEQARIARTASMVEIGTTITAIREMVRDTQPPRGSGARIAELVLMEVKRQQKIQSARDKRRDFVDPLMSPGDSLSVKLLRKTVAEVGAAFAKCNYRKPTSSWAGGNWTLTVCFGSPYVVTNRYKVWSDNGKWSGMDAEWKIAVPRHWHRLISGNPISEKGELILDITDKGPVTVKQSRGVELILRWPKG
jgi:hypothetical protein